MVEFDAVAYLAGKGYSGKATNGPEVQYPCFFDCAEDAHSKKRKLYYNVVEGFYYCFVCGASGGSYRLQQWFGDDPRPTEPGTDPYVRTRILRWAADVGAEMLSNNDKILLYLLNDRGLTEETIVERRLGYVGNRWSLIGSLPGEFKKEELTNTGLVNSQGRDSFYNHLLIPYLSRGNVVQIRGRAWDPSANAKYVTGTNDVVRLYNIDSLEGADDCIITEGEFDAMVLAQHLSTATSERARKTAVVGLAGVQAIPDDFEDYFTHVKRIFVGFDPDDTGKRHALKLKERFGSRCRIIELPAELPKCDWTEYLLPVAVGADEQWRNEHPHAGHTWRDVVALMGNAAGKRVFSIREAARSWREAAKEAPGLKTGYKGLDDIIAPGLKPGQVFVFLAKTGAGKTLILCNLAYLMREEPTLIVSLEMTREEVYDRLRRIFLFHHPRASEDEIEEGLANILICDENRLTEKALEELVDEYEVETGKKCTVCHVDYLGYFARGAQGNSPYEKTGNAVMSLKAIAKAKKLVIFSPSQVSRQGKDGKPLGLDDARDSGAVEESADFLVALYRPDDALNPDDPLVHGTGAVKLSVLKSRHGGKGKNVDLLMDMVTLAIVEPYGKVGDRAARHTRRYYQEGLKYHQLRKEETAPIQTALAVGSG